MLFWAKINPVCDASTDFGLMRPVISSTRRMRSSSDGASSTGVLGDVLGTGAPEGLGPLDGAEAVGGGWEEVPAGDGRGSAGASEASGWLSGDEGAAEGEDWPDEGGTTAAGSGSADRWALISRAMASKPTRAAAAAASRMYRPRSAGLVSGVIVAQAYSGPSDISEDLDDPRVAGDPDLSRRYVIRDTDGVMTRPETLDDLHGVGAHLGR